MLKRLRQRTKGGRRMKMAVVIDLKNYKTKRASVFHNISLVDMVNNPTKRKDYYKYIDSKYEETEEEREIFLEATRRRRGR